MKIVNIVPGFGGSFYCGNCLRDSGYTKSLIKLGHDAIMLPIYLPLTIEQTDIEDDTPLFYGAVNVYLKQNFKIFRNMPLWLEKFFNSSAILRYAAKKAGSTRADGLEEMTISMLNGDEGYQSKELQELIDFLKNHEKPDVVHLSNALLMGLAKKIRQELNIPVVCSLQDEDVWVDAMKPDFQEKLWKLLHEKSKDIDAFIAVSDYFAQYMQKNMKPEASKMHTISIGIDTSLYKVSSFKETPEAVGFLSRMYEPHGFGIFIDAFILLKQNPDFKHIKAIVTGGMTGDDKKYVKKQIKKLEKNKLLSDVEFIENFKTENLIHFFEKISLLSVPVLKGEAFGTYQIESLASGVPLVQPNLGAFPEIIEKTGGGVIFEPNTPEELSKTWAKVLSNPLKLREMRENGIKAVNEKFTSMVLSKEVLDVYEKVVSKMRNSTKK